MFNHLWFHMFLAVRIWAPCTLQDWFNLEGSELTTPSCQWVAKENQVSYITACHVAKSYGFISDLVILDAFKALFLKSRDTARIWAFLLKKVAFILSGGFENSQIRRQERLLHIPFGEPYDFFLQPRGFSALIRYFWKFATADNMSVRFRCCHLSQMVPTGWSVCQRRVLRMHLLQCVTQWHWEPLLRISGTTAIKIINKWGIAFYPEMLV